MSLSIRKRGLFSFTGLSDEIHLFAALHANVDITFLLISFTCALAVEWAPNSLWDMKDTFSFVLVD